MASDETGSPCVSLSLVAFEQSRGLVGTCATKTEANRRAQDTRPLNLHNSLSQKTGTIDIDEDSVLQLYNFSKISYYLLRNRPKIRNRLGKQLRLGWTNVRLA